MAADNKLLMKRKMLLKTLPSLLDVVFRVMGYLLGVFPLLVMFRKSSRLPWAACAKIWGAQVIAT